MQNGWLQSHFHSPLYISQSLFQFYRQPSAKAKIETFELSKESGLKARWNSNKPIGLVGLGGGEENKHKLELYKWKHAVNWIIIHKCSTQVLYMSCTVLFCSECAVEEAVLWPQTLRPIIQGGAAYNIFYTVQLWSTALSESNTIPYIFSNNNKLDVN